MRVMTAGTAAAVIATACISLGADWPQFLGPERNSTSPETGILRSWPASGPEVLWTVPVGRGYGGPVVKDGEVYLLDRDDAVGGQRREPAAPGRVVGERTGLVLPTRRQVG